MIEFSFPGISENKRTTLNYQPVRAERDGDEIIIVGILSDFQGFVKTMVDKLPAN
jgi:hypothetical protein